MVEFVQQIMDPLRTDIVKSCLKSLEMGWTPAEVVIGVNGGKQIPVRFKPLLVDISKIIADKYGQIIGIENKSGDDNKAVSLYGPNAFIFSNDPEPDNPYGNSRSENIRCEYSEATQTRQRMAQYLKKVCTIIPTVHFPEGTSNDASGSPRPNQWIAQSLIDMMSRGYGVALLNKYASAANISEAAELAGKSDWVIDFLNPGPGQHGAEMLASLKYYDELLFMGWLRPPRAGLESTHGSRADSQQHTATGNIDGTLIDIAIADAVSRQIIDPMLELNFGAGAAGAVYIDPPPIEDNAIQAFLAIITPLLANPIIAPWLTSLLNMPMLLDRLDVPIEDDMRKNKFVPPPVQTPANGTQPSNGNTQPGTGTHQNGNGNPKQKKPSRFMQAIAGNGDNGQN
jgi:hypothetical protein